MGLGLPGDGASSAPRKGELSIQSSPFGIRVNFASGDGGVSRFLGLEIRHTSALLRSGALAVTQSSFSWKNFGVSLDRGGGGGAFASGGGAIVDPLRRRPPVRNGGSGSLAATGEPTMSQGSTMGQIKPAQAAGRAALRGGSQRQYVTGAFAD